MLRGILIILSILSLLASGCGFLFFLSGAVQGRTDDPIAVFVRNVGLICFLSFLALFIAAFIGYRSLRKRDESSQLSRRLGED
jgi:hypothetical protein